MIHKLIRKIVSLRGFIGDYKLTTSVVFFNSGDAMPGEVLINSYMYIL